MVKKGNFKGIRQRMSIKKPGAYYSRLNYLGTFIFSDQKYLGHLGILQPEAM